MKLICAGALENENGVIDKHCTTYCRCHEPHEPHEHDGELNKDEHGITYECRPYFEETGDIDMNDPGICTCVPVTLEYYMKKIIKKDEEKNAIY